MTFRGSVFLTCILVAACGEATAPAHDVTLATTHAWSAGSIELRSPGFVSVLPVVIVASESLAVTRINDSTIAARLPPLSAGAYAVRVEGTGIHRAAGDVNVHGLIDIVFGPEMYDFPLPWPGQETPGVLANAGDDHLIFLDLRTMSVHAFPDSVHNRLCTWGPGPSYRADRVVLAGLTATGGCARWSIWAVSPDLSLTRVDTALGPADRLAAELSPTVRLVALHHTVYTIGGTDSLDPPYSYRNSYEETAAIRVSPRRDVATLLMNWTHDNGLPFLDAVTGSPRFSLMELGSGGGAAFSASGDTVFVAGKDSSLTHALVLAVDAATGQRLITDTLPDVFPLDVALDPNGKWVYVLGWARVVTVLDRFTLQVAGRIDLPGMCTCIMRLVQSVPERTLYVVGMAGPSRIARLDVGMP